MKKKLKNNFIEIYIAINIIFLQIISFLFTKEIITFKSFGQSIIYLSIINIIISLIVFIYKKIVKKKYKFNILDILMLLMIGFGILSIFFAINKNYAIYGYEGRYEGIFAIIYYLTLFYLSTFIKKNNKKKIAFIIVITGVIQALYGYLQITDTLVERVEHYEVLWAIGFTNNPNFFGSYMIISLAFALGLFIEEKNRLYQICFATIIGILSLGLIISNTLSCVVGLCVVLIILFIYCIKYKKWKKLIIPIVIILSMLIVLDKANLASLVKDIIKTKDETVEIAKGNIDGSFGTKRVAIWRETFKIVPDNFWFGVGVDNYGVAFDGRMLIIGRNLIDKAHNELLQTLVTQGIFCLICYVTFYSIILYRGFKHTFKNKTIYLLLPVVGYLVQSMFNISVIEVAPIFYISLGLLVERQK